GVDARPVVADQGEVVAALEALRRKGGREQAHLVGELPPGPGLPDAAILLADRGARAALQRVAHEQLGKRVQRALLPSSGRILAQKALKYGARPNPTLRTTGNERHGTLDPQGRRQALPLAQARRR